MGNILECIGNSMKSYKHTQDSSATDSPLPTTAMVIEHIAQLADLVNASTTQLCKLINEKSVVTSQDLALLRDELETMKRNINALSDSAWTQMK